MNKESFASMLRVGEHRNSLGRSGEIVELLLIDSARIGELFSCISDEDAWVRMRAIDAFEKVIREKPELAAPYIPMLFDELMKRDQPSIQWHLAEIFCEIKLDDSHRKQAIQWMKSHLSTVDVDWIVSANCMKGLMHFLSNDQVEKDELAALLKVQLKHKSKAVRKKADQYLREVV